MDTSVVKSASFKELRDLADARSQNILSNYDVLNSAVRRHEAVIRKRWVKRTRKQREEILVAAWEGPMSSHHRPDFKIWSQMSQTQQDDIPLPAEAFKWPHINREDLSDSKNLLLVINSRGRNEPSTFVCSDHDSTHLGRTIGALHQDEWEGFWTQFRRGSKPSTYCMIFERAIHAISDTYATYDDIVASYEARHGLLVLEIQDRIMSFLVNCVQRLLADLGPLHSHHGPFVPEPPHLSDIALDSKSFTTLAVEEPYRVPALFDHDAVVSLLEAKKDEAGDHLWSLREDPGYLLKHLCETKDHHYEMIKDVNGRSLQNANSKQTDYLWTATCHNTLITAHLEYEWWSGFSEQASQLKNLHKDRPLVSDSVLYRKVLLKFRYELEQFSIYRLLRLETAFLSSYPWRSKFERDPASDTGPPDRLGATLRSTVKLDKYEHELVTMLQMFRRHHIRSDSTKTILTRSINLADEMHRLLQQSRKLNLSATLYVTSLLADLSVAMQCIHRLNHYDPWTDICDMALRTPGQIDVLEEEFVNCSASVESMLMLLSAPSKKDLAVYEKLTRVGLRYPVGRRTKINVDAMRAAESRVDKVWARIDAIMLARVDGWEDTAVKKFLTAPHVLRRTPEWHEAPPTAVTTRSAGSLQDVTAICKPLSEVYLDLQQRTERTIDKQETFTKGQTKSKIKVRSGQCVASGPDNSSQRAMIQNDTEPEQEERTTIAVDHRALKVFNILFFNPSTTSEPGEVHWKDFLHALTSVDFETRRLQGSMWHFKPTKIASNRSIIFHEPHPVSKISYLVARFYGRRLNRVYGWDSSTFVLASKSKGG